MTTMPTRVIPRPTHMNVRRYRPRKAAAGGQAQDGQHIGDVVRTAGKHGNGGCGPAGAHERATGTGRGHRGEQPEFQDDVERGLNAEPNDDRDDDPTVAPEQLTGSLETLRPRHDPEIQASQEEHPGQACSKGDKDTLCA